MCIRDRSSTSGVISVPFWIMPADCWITCWLTSKTASTILKVFVRIITATKVLNTHCFILVLSAFLEVLLAYLHPDRITDIVGILLYYHTELVVLKILVVLLFFGIFLYLKGYLCACLLYTSRCV